MSLNGSLSDFSVLETLQVIGLQRKTGILEIQAGRRRRELHFHEGRLTGCHATRADDPDPFLEALVGWGLLDGAVARTLRPPTGGPAPIDAVRRASAGGEAVLEEVWVRVLHGTLDQVLLWDRGHFRFTPATPAEGASGGWSVEQALLESMRRLDEVADLRASGIAPEAVPHRLRPDLGAAEPGPPLERAILRACDGRRSLRQVAALLGLADYDVLSGMRELQSRGILELRGRRLAEPAAAPLEAPRRLRHPAVPALLALFVLAVSASGWLVHGLTAAAGWNATEAALALRSAWDEEHAIRHALEIHRLRTGEYPRQLAELVDSDAWPSALLERLATHHYTLEPEGGYALDGVPIDAPRIRTAASSRSSATRSAPASTGPSERSAASTERP